MPRKIEISHRTIIFTVFFLLFLWFLYKIKDILLQFFVALLIMAILNPTVTKFSRYKIPRVVIVLGIYVIFLIVVSFAIGAVIPPLVEQTTAFASSLQRFVNNLWLPLVLKDQIIEQVVSQLAALPTHAAKVTVSLFSNFLAFLAVMVFSFYLLTQKEVLYEQLGFFWGESRKKEIFRIINLIETRLGSWARGQMTLMVVVGAANYIGLTLLGIPFATPLAILAGLLEIVPYIGPILAAIPAVLIGFGVSPITGLAVAALAFLIQQFENYLFVPKIMQRSVGVNPIVTLLALAIGFRLAGVVGLLISIPVFITLEVLTKELLLSK